MKKPLSRQRLYQLKLKSEGRCELCAKELHPVLLVCDPCSTKKKIRLREKKGFNEKVPNGPGRPRKCLDDTGTKATNEIELKMSKANYALSNRALSEDLQVSETTVSKYRKIYSTTPKGLTDIELQMADADYSLSDKELVYLLGVSQHTVSKYRKIYGPK